MPEEKSIFKKVFPRTPLTRMLFFVIGDILLIIAAVYLSFFLRFDFQIPARYLLTIQKVIILALAFCLPIFYFQKLYSFSWTYASANELVSLFKATTLGFLFLGIALYISKDFPAFQGFPRSTFFISYFLIFIFCGGFRFSKRLYLQLFKETGKSRVLIVGAGDSGEEILRSILGAKDSSYLPVGLADDNPQKQGETIHGLRVLGRIADIPPIVKKNQIEEMIIALPSAGSGAIRQAVEMGRIAGLKKIKVIPAISELINGEVSVGNIREVEIEDLLGREPVLLDQKSIENFIQGKVILISGAAGSIGAELSRQTAKFNPASLLLLDQDETGIFNILGVLKDKFPRLNVISLIADIRDQGKIERVFAAFRPKVVFHAAAYKHVPLMEEQPEEAVKNNVFGTKIVAEAGLKYAVENFIFISTDKAVNPTSVMGATKRVGEKICQTLNQRNQTKFISVSFGNVLDSRGSVIPIFKEQIKRGGPLTVTHPEMKRYFMVTSEAVLLVMQAGAFGKGGEVFVLDMGEPIKILDLAKEMIRFSGFEPDRDIPIVFSGPRPGEKLFEEILTAEEGTVATGNKKIFIAKLSAVDGKTLTSGLEKLRAAAENLEREKIRIILKELVPSYQPALPQN